MVHNHPQCKEEPGIVLALQFRPPIGKISVEFPAGLIDKGETPTQAGLRELKEECGLVGSSSGASNSLAIDSGMTNSSAVLVFVDVDGSLPENLVAQQTLEPTENIEVVLVPISRLLETLQQLEREGCMIHIALYAYAAGLHQNTKAE
jgi:8-oxo-dGTP pyrophosphatase MutT (NUDIX family)